MKRVCALLPLAAGAMFAAQDSPADARNLLREVAAVYRNLGSFEWTALYTTSSDSGEIQKNTSPIKGAFRRPHAMRIEWNGKSPPMNYVSGTNGRETWLYYKESRAFCRPDSRSYLDRTPHEGMGTLEASLPYEHILDGARSVRREGDRVLRVGGEEIHCVVVTVAYAPAKSGWSGITYGAPVTYWIDVKTHLVMQQSYRILLKIPGRSAPRSDTFTITLTGYKVNPELPDSRFQLRPAAGSREWPCSSLSGGG